MVKTHLISGITGQDGVFLTSHILKNKPKDNVIGLSRNKKDEVFYNKLNYILKNTLNKNNIRILNIDIINENKVKEIIKEIKPNYIYNLSGPSSVYKSMLPNSNTANNIIKIFNNLVKPIIDENLDCNFYQSSSSEMFDISTKPLDENSNFKTRSPYAEGKFYIHNLIQKIKVEHNLNISSGIMFNHESEFRKDEYLIMKIIKAAILISKKQEDSLKIGSLHIERDWSYAGDVANAIYKINENNTSEDYVIGSGVGNSIETILDIIFNYFKLNWQNYVEIDSLLLRPGDPESIISNPKKIYENLGWKAETSLEELLIKCIDYKKNS